MRVSTSDDDSGMTQIHVVVRVLGQVDRRVWDRPTLAARPLAGEAGICFLEPRAPATSENDALQGGSRRQGAPTSAVLGALARGSRRPMLSTDRGLHRHWEDGWGIRGGRHLNRCCSRICRRERCFGGRGVTAAQRTSSGKVRGESGTDGGRSGDGGKRSWLRFFLWGHAVCGTAKADSSTASVVESFVVEGVRFTVPYS